MVHNTHPESSYGTPQKTPDSFVHRLLPSTLHPPAAFLLRTLPLQSPGPPGTSMSLVPILLSNPLRLRRLRPRPPSPDSPARSEVRGQRRLRLPRVVPRLARRRVEAAPPHQRLPAVNATTPLQHLVHRPTPASVRREPVAYLLAVPRPSRAPPHATAPPSSGTGESTP